MRLEKKGISDNLVGENFLQQFGSNIKTIPTIRNSSAQKNAPSPAHPPPVPSADPVAARCPPPAPGTLSFWPETPPGRCF